MKARNKEMSKTVRAMYISVLESLKMHDCIAAYTIGGQNANAEWNEGGFDRAFQEFSSNPKPFGLKKKREIAVLMVVLMDQNPQRVEAFMKQGFKERYGLNLDEG